MAVCLLLAIALAACRPVTASARWRKIGYLLVAIPLPSAVALHGLVFHGGLADDILFVAGAVTFALGAVLVLGRDEPMDGGTTLAPPEPHWWPDFERQFDAYVRGAAKRREWTRR